MPDPSQGQVVLALSRSPVRRILRDWLGAEGFDVQEAHAWEVDRLLGADLGARLLVTSDDLDGEWGWSDRLGTGVLVLALPERGAAG